MSETAQSRDKESQERDSEDKTLEEAIFNGISSERIQGWLQSRSPEEILAELERLKKLKSELKERAKREGKLFQFYITDLKYYIAYRLPRHLLTLTQIFLIVEKIYEIPPFGYLNWIQVFTPLIIDIAFSQMLSKIFSDSSSEK